MEEKGKGSNRYNPDSSSDEERSSKHFKTSRDSYKDDYRSSRDSRDRRNRDDRDDYSRDRYDKRDNDDRTKKETYDPLLDLDSDDDDDKRRPPPPGMSVPPPPKDRRQQRADQKRKLLWGNKTKEEPTVRNTSTLAWAKSAEFEDQNRKDKFLALMGAKKRKDPEIPSENLPRTSKQEQERFLSSLEKQFQDSIIRKEGNSRTGLG